MIYLLGGPPRVGKTIIAGEIRQKTAVSVISTDTLGAVLEKVLSPETTPDLFVFERFNHMPPAERAKMIRKDPSTLIEYVRKESRVVWEAVEAVLRRENEEGREILVEGTAVLPELVSQLKGVPYRAVFIGNQGVGHEANIKKSIEAHPHDWMRDASDEYISAFAMFVNRMSTAIEQEAERYDFEYIEIDKRPFERITEDVIQLLELSRR